MSPQCLVRILIEIIRQLPKARGGPPRSLPQAGDVLRSCYIRGLLSQPAGTEIESYRTHLWLLCQAAHLANICFKARLSLENNGLESYGTTETLLQISFVEAMQAIRLPPKATPQNLPRAEGVSFRVNDLNIRTLRTIGELSIKWTMYWDEHLLLDVQNRQLMVAWFSVHSYFYYGRRMDIGPYALFW